MPYNILENINKNFIIGEIYIDKEDINKDIQIINSFENLKREGKLNVAKDYEYDYENEKEIKGNIEIKINGKIIEFIYYYKFKDEGKYIIEYKFKNNLTKTNHMFYGCDLTNLDLSNFNTQNVTNMSWMFSRCNSLTNLNLLNFNTQNVTNMSCMFYGCNSLTNLNLSNFTTQNVPDIKYMFSDCKSLKKKNIITKDKKILNYFNKCLII